MDNIKLLQNKLKSAIRSRSKNVTLTIEESSLLIAEINNLIIDLTNSDKKIIKLLEDSANEKIEFKSDEF